MSATDHSYDGCVGPSRKRRREDQDDDWKATSIESRFENGHTVASIIEPVVHDPKYYKNDGDCVFRVQNTLFKVHRVFLSRDSSVFEDMFALPQNADKSEVDGLSDERPIQLPGDTLEQFRMLLWILYAFPQEIEALLDNKIGRLPELLTIAEVTHKYQFTGLAAWSTGKLKSVVDSSVNQIRLVDQERMLRVAIHANDTPLLDALVSVLTTSLQNGSLAPAEMITIADHHGIRPLQGAAYYAQLMLLQNDSSDTFRFPEGCTLNRDQRVRLLSGYWSLVRRWECLLRDSPFPTQPLLRSMWREHAKNPMITQQTKAADLLEKLRTMKYLMQNEPVTSNSQQGSNAASSQSSNVMGSQYNHSITPNNLGPTGNQSLFAVSNQNPPNIMSTNYQLPPTVPTFSHHRTFGFFSSFMPSAQARAVLVQQTLDDAIKSLPDYFSDRTLGL